VEGCDFCNHTGIDSEFTDEIVCPYCGHEFGDSWEFNDSDGKKIDCYECDKTFELSVNFEATYTTRRIKED
jgi:DNA-directed RNA polymerase subunit RPC12/RpoP